MSSDFAFTLEGSATTSGNRCLLQDGAELGGTKPKKEKKEKKSKPQSPRGGADVVRALVRPRALGWG